MTDHPGSVPYTCAVCGVELYHDINHQHGQQFCDTCFGAIEQRGMDIMYEYGYRFDFASFSEVVFPDGTVVRRTEQPGGGAHYAITEKFLNDDEYFRSLADQGIDNDGREISGDELEPWLAPVTISPVQLSLF